MIEIIEQGEEIRISKSYSKYIKFYKIYTIFFILLFSIITLKTIGIFFNFLSTILIVGYIYLSLFTISNERMTIKENYLLLEAIRGNKKVLYSKKIMLDDVKKVYFKDTLGISLILNSGIINYLLNSRQKFMKIETDKKIYSFGLFIPYDDFLKIDRIIQNKIREYKNQKVLIDTKERQREKSLNICNLEVEERYRAILNIILNEEKVFLFKKDDGYIVNGDSEAIKNLEVFKGMDFKEIDFYVFYVNYLSKREYEDKKVLVGYNGVDGKEASMLKLKEDINEIRDKRSTFK